VKPIALARPDIGPQEYDAVRRVMESGWITQGAAVEEFERTVAEYCGAAHAVAVSSCTTALHLALVAAEIGAGDEVIVPSMSFIASANAIVHAGATPVFAEVDPDSFNLNVDETRRRITAQTKAIMVVHQLGLPAELDGLRAVARENGLVVIEDAACALGSSYRGTPIGGSGLAVCFSFHPRKVITTGEGGMIVTDSESFAARLSELRNHGMSISDFDRHRADRVVRETYRSVGYNYRLTDMQAAMGTVQMGRLSAMLATRRRLADVYDKSFSTEPAIAVPIRPTHVEWNVQTYALRLVGFTATARDAVMQNLLDHKIASRAGVMAIHREPAYAAHAADLPLTEGASDGSLMLPLHGGLTEDDCRYVAEHVVRAVKEAKP